MAGASRAFASAAVPMPKIFVYNTSHARALDVHLAGLTTEAKKEWAFGRLLGGGGGGGGHH